MMISDLTFDDFDPADFDEPEPLTPSERIRYGVVLACHSCGRFMSRSQPGGSWCQTWGYDMSGTPELYDPIYRCARCTDKLGIPKTNCDETRSKYSGYLVEEPKT